MDNQNDNADGKVDRLLNDWSVDAELPEGFSKKVWNRIASEENQMSVGASLKLLFETVGNLLRMPSFAASFLVAVLALGAGIGWVRADRQNMAYHEELGMKYVQRIDPYHLHTE